MANKQIKRTKVKLACGCKLIEVGHEAGKTKVVYDSIEYCPKHKAAPDMYEALKASLKLINDVTSGGSKTKKLIKQALSKADGK